jgi:hypothetical protein
MKVRILKFIQCGPCSINGPRFLEILFFETFDIAIGHFAFVTLKDFMYISIEGVCGKNLRPRKFV